MAVQQHKEGVSLFVLLEHVRALRVAKRLGIPQHLVDVFRREAGEQWQVRDNGSIDTRHLGVLGSTDF
jgi:hypothetical protein